jgi:hypothetical protein
VLGMDEIFHGLAELDPDDKKQEKGAPKKTACATQNAVHRS